MASANDPGELREDIPLKNGAKSSKLCLYGEDCFGGSRFITISFAALTVIITAALLIQIYYGDYQVVPHGSVATDSRECSMIGTSVLKDGGNAVDATIASALCLSVVNPHTTGLDAEGQLLIYSHRTQNDPEVIDFANIQISSTLPRLILGLAYLHQKYALLPWRSLVEPAANLAKVGFLVPKMLASAISKSKVTELYGPLEAGQKFQLKDLGDTLQSIAEIPEEDLYKYVTMSNQTQALKSTVLNYNIFTPNFPIETVLINSLKTIESINATTTDLITYQLIAISEEIYKQFNVTTNFHQGTSSNIAVIDLHDMYVSFISGMYRPFGSGKMTSGGYLSDFRDINWSPTYIPIIMTDSDFICGRRLVLAVGDVTVATQIITSLLVTTHNLTESIEAPRFNILTDGTVGLEEFHNPVFDDDIIKYLEETLKIPITRLYEPYGSCNVVQKIGDDLYSHSDSRGGGIASRF